VRLEPKQHIQVLVPTVIKLFYAQDSLSTKQKFKNPHLKNLRLLQGLYLKELHKT
jgi:hypothetical protein